jgi:hypothetical protein
MGKRPANPRADELKRTRLQLTEACKEKAIYRVLDIFHECEMANLTLPQSFLAQALSAFALASEEAPRRPPNIGKVESAQFEYFGHAQKLFDRTGAKIRDWGSHAESIYTLMVRLASRAGELALAMQYLREMGLPPVSMKPRLRTFIPIFEACAFRGFVAEAEILYHEDLLPACGPSEPVCPWNSEEEERLWLNIFSLRISAWRAAAAQECNPDCSGLNVILQDTKSICPHFLSDCGIISVLQDAFGLIDWWTEFGVRIPAHGVCPVTQQTLQAIHPDEADLRSLLILIERLATEGVSQRKLDDWATFKEWLEQTTSIWDTIIDGANVGHANQNFEGGNFSHHQIDAVIAQCAMIEKRKPVVVLRGHWLSPDTDFSLPLEKKKHKSLPQLGLSDEVVELAQPERISMSIGAKEFAPSCCEEKCVESGHDTELSESHRRTRDIVRKWKDQDELIVSPASINDDWVALYLAVAMCLRGVPDVQFVSNDELRDHFWRMRQPLAFKLWRERHATRYDIVSHCTLLGEQAPDGSEMIVQLFPPPLYSQRTQRSLNERCWHFPVRTTPSTQEIVSKVVREDLEQVEWFVACAPNKV